MLQKAPMLQHHDVAQFSLLAEGRPSRQLLLQLPVSWQLSIKAPPPLKLLPHWKVIHSSVATKHQVADIQWLQAVGKTTSENGRDLRETFLFQGSE